MSNRLSLAASFCLLAGVASAFAQPPALTPGGPNPVAPGTERLPWYARVPYPDTNNQPTTVDFGVPAGQFEHTGRVIRLTSDALILSDRIGMTRVILINESTWVKHGPSSGSWEQIQEGTAVKVRGKRGKAAETVEVVADVEN